MSERASETEKDREAERQRKQGRQRETERDRERQRGRAAETEKAREADRQTERAAHKPEFIWSAALLLQPLVELHPLLHAHASSERGAEGRGWGERFWLSLMGARILSHTHTHALTLTHKLSSMQSDRYRPATRSSCSLCSAPPPRSPAHGLRSLCRTASHRHVCSWVG
eukprot:947105-Rhodomonas_salina.1